MPWRKETYAAYRPSEREVHESEQAFWKGICELYHLGWIKTPQVKKYYLERVGWYGTMSYRFRVALAQLADGSVLLMDVNGGSSGDEKPWYPYRAEVYKDWSTYGRSPYGCLQWTSQNPLIWDRRHEGVPIADLVIFIGEKTCRRFARRLKSYFS